MAENNETNEQDSTTGKKKVPTWVWVVSGVLVFGLILQSCGEDTPAVEDSEAEIVETEAQVDEKTEPEVEAQTEPEVEEETEPAVELTVEEAREIVFPLVFSSSRSGVIDILNDLRTVESVDLYSYDETAGVVAIDVSPAFDFDSGVRDDAWEIFRLFSVFYEEPDGNWLSTNPRFAPELQVKISSATYQCDADSMRNLADAMLSRSAWESECRVR